MEINGEKQTLVVYFMFRRGLSIIEIKINQQNRIRMIGNRLKVNQTFAKYQNEKWSRFVKFQREEIKRG